MASGVSSSIGGATGATPRLGKSFSSDSPFAINMSGGGSSSSPILNGSDGSGRWQPNNPPGFDIRTNRALDENDRLGGIGSSLDSFLAQGQAVMGNLAGQRDMLKGEFARYLSSSEPYAYRQCSARHSTTITVCGKYIGAVTRDDHLHRAANKG